MSNVINMPLNENSCVSRVSVMVSKYSEENGGSEKGSGTIYAVETLFPDGKWTSDSFHRDLIEAKAAAAKVAANRGAPVLIESLWSTRKVND